MEAISAAQVKQRPTQNMFFVPEARPPQVHE
uniref:Uncharacterized protein n=1 Tax=Anguilla anguilla TaxID=7936 RepID=A0A0E9U3B3_ANGAN